MPAALLALTLTALKENEMNTTSTLIADLPEAGLATLTGGVDWVVSATCMMAAALVDALFPGLGSVVALSCYFPV